MFGWRVLSQYLLAFMLSLLAFLCITKTYHHDLTIPFDYYNDALFTSSWIKSIIDTGWYLKNPFLGAPGGYNMAIFPVADQFHLLIIKLLSLITHHYAVILNLFYILTFPASTLSALFVFKRLGLSYPLALSGSVLFAFLPYHSIHGVPHLFLSSYYIVPLVVWLCVSVLPCTKKQEEKGKFYYPGLLVLCILIGSSGVYYAFFGVFYLILSSVIYSLIHKNLLPLKKACLFIGAITLTTGLNVLSCFIDKTNHNTIERFPFESETYALKIAPLIFPVSGHRVHLLARLREKYDTTSIRNNTGAPGALGILGDAGFLLLLGFLLVKPSEKWQNTPLAQIARLNLGGILLATMGGFGAIFAYTISPMIRCYDRMSIYIAFFSLFSFFYFCQYGIDYLQRRAQAKERLLWLAALITLVLGLFDQTTHADSFQRSEKKITAEVHSDQSFVKAIETKMNGHGMVFQLPYFPFPEVDYDLLKPYLNSTRQIQWSFGAALNSPVDLWQHKVSRMPIAKMVSALRHAGVKGIYINRTKYHDHAAKMEKQLTRLLGHPPLVSENKKTSFYSL